MELILPKEGELASTISEIRSIAGGVASDHMKPDHNCAICDYCNQLMGSTEWVKWIATSCGADPGLHLLCHALPKDVLLVPVAQAMTVAFLIGAMVGRKQAVALPEETAK